MDNGTWHTSLLICNEFCELDTRIRCINQKNAGVSVARNNGKKNATGKYIIFVDSDDTLQWIITSFCIQAFFLLYGITGNPIYDKEMFIPYFVACAATLTVKQKLVKQEQGEYY